MVSSSGFGQAQAKGVFLGHETLFVTARSKWHKIPINRALPHFGDVVVVHQAFKKPPSFETRGVTGVCLGHDSRIAGGVLVVSVVNGELKEACSAKVRHLGEKIGQAWRLHVHPQDSSKAAYVNRKGEVKWNLQPTVEQSVREEALRGSGHS